MWGSDEWGSMVWSGGIIPPLPTLDWAAVFLLVSTLLIGGTLYAKRVHRARAHR
jgi:hypothetical protein